MERAVDVANTRDRSREDQLTLAVPRTSEELRSVAASVFSRVLPGLEYGVLFESEKCTFEVEFATPNSPFQIGCCLESSNWAPADETFELEYQSDTIGKMLIYGPVGDAARAELHELLPFFTVALVNLKLNEEALNYANEYLASLQAFEEGVVLFQEANPEAVGARFLSLVSSVLDCQACALYICEDMGQEDTSMALNTALGLPESMLDELCTPDGTWWPGTRTTEPLQFLKRGEDGVFPELDSDRVPSVMNNLLCIPLRYQGVTAGVCLALNVSTSDISLSYRFQNVRRLGELGAVLYHRLQLENQALRSRELQTQLTIAGSIQSRLMPSSAPQISTVECAWSSKPAETVGGDYLDLVTGDAGDLFAVIADVSGHGLDSALLMTSFRSTYRAECMWSEPHELLGRLNDEVSGEVGDTGMFITAASFRIDKDGRSFTYASAGHNPMFLYRAQSKMIEQLDSTGASLGFFRGMEFDIGAGNLHTDDVLLLYTDGIVEATSASDEMYGDDRLIDLLRENAEKPAQVILDRVFESVDEFTGGCPLDDDTSVSVIKIL